MLSPRSTFSRVAASIAALSLSSLAGCYYIPTALTPASEGSVGSASYGVLTRPIEMPTTGNGFKLFRPYGANHYGSDPLVKMLKEGAEAAKTSPDAPPLVIGDLAAKTGGEVEGHKSHRTGRDVDILFFYQTPAGIPIEAPGFVKVQTDGIAFVQNASTHLPYYALDLPRNWALVKSLVTSKHAQVQWLFVARQVESLIIEYARARDEDPMVIWQAESVMHEPADSMPHDDHFHLRIACTPDELTHGCINNGPQWPWLDASPVLSTEEVLQALAADP